MTEDELIKGLKHEADLMDSEFTGLGIHLRDAISLITKLKQERDEARSRFNDIDLCKLGAAPCTQLLKEISRTEAAEARNALLPEGEWTVELQEIERPTHHTMFAADTFEKALGRANMYSGAWRLIRISRADLGGDDE